MVTKPEILGGFSGRNLNAKVVQYSEIIFDLFSTVFRMTLATFKTIIGQLIKLIMVTFWIPFTI